jgi:hypothetical protein
LTICPRCGRWLGPGARTCPTCGSVIEEGSTNPGDDERKRILIELTRAKANELRELIYEKNPDARIRIYCNEEVNACVLDIRDAKLEELLERYGKTRGAWTSKGSIEIRGPSPFVIEEADIPINMQACEVEVSRHPEELHPLIEELQIPKGTTCEMHSVHIHDGLGISSSHLRLRCSSAGKRELDLLSDLVVKSQMIGRAICEGKTLEELKKELHSLTST